MDMQYLCCHKYLKIRWLSTTTMVSGVLSILLYSVILSDKTYFLNTFQLMADLGVPGLKAAMDLLGLYGGPCREPMLPTSKTDIERIKSTLAQDNLL